MNLHYNEEENSVFLGKNRYAPWIGGFGTNFTWKGFSVIADFAWQSGKYMTVNDNYFIMNAGQGTSFNQSVEMLNIWRTPTGASCSTGSTAIRPAWTASWARTPPPYTP